MPPPLPNISEARPPHVLLYSSVLDGHNLQGRVQGQRSFFLQNGKPGISLPETMMPPSSSCPTIIVNIPSVSLFHFSADVHAQNTFQVIFSAIGFALFLPFRSLKLAPFKRASIGLRLGSGGFTCGKIAFLVSHFDYMNCLEKPHGFHKAMEIYKHKLVPPKDGVFMQRVYELSPDDMDP